MRWVRHARYRMGTIWEMAVWISDRAQALDALDGAFSDVMRLERLMSRFLPESQVNRLGGAAGRSRVPIDPALCDVLLLAQAVAVLSGGVLDVTIGPLVTLWDQAQAAGVMPTSCAVRAARTLVDYRAVVVDRAESTAGLLRAGMSLDLGAIGKGFAVDRSVEWLSAEGYQHGWVNAGGNIRFLGPWGREVAVRDPRQPDRVLVRVPVDGGAVSTSANYERGWDIGGRLYGHLLDPRTGWPTIGCLSVTVFAPSATLADALSTACFVLGPQPGARLCRAFPGVEALWCVGADQQPMRVMITPGLIGRLEGFDLRGVETIEEADAAVSMA